MKRAAVVALLALALAGCMVPGETLPPGAAFSYDGEVTTNAQVDTTYRAWVDDTENKDNPNRRQVMTLEALHEPAIAAAKPFLEDTEITLSEEEAQQLADQWLSFLGLHKTASPEVARTAQTAYAIAIVAYSDTDGSALRELAEEAAASIEGSPRAGVFDADAFIASVYGAAEAAQNQDLQMFFYTAFQNINGFVDPPTDLRQLEPEPAASPAG